MSWDYRIVTTEGEFDIHEVYYSKDGAIEGWTEQPVAPYGDTRSELLDDLALMAMAARRPVLVWDRVSDTLTPLETEVSDG